MVGEGLRAFPKDGLMKRELSKLHGITLAMSVYSFVAGQTLIIVSTYY